jgi:hypothetical protein
MDHWLLSKLEYTWREYQQPTSHSTYLPRTACSLHSCPHASLCARDVQVLFDAPHMQSCNSDDTSPSQAARPGMIQGSGNTVTTVSYIPTCCTLTYIATIYSKPRYGSGVQVTSFPPWQPGFNSKSGHVGFVDKVAMGQVFSQYFGFNCQFSF